MGFWKAARRLALAGLACVAYGTFVESKLYQVRRVKLPVLPPKSEPIRLLHISDAHLLDRDRRAVEFIKSLAGLEPDIVVATGDMISEAESIPVLADALGRLLEKPGVFTLGSSDYLKPRAVNPFKYLRERGQRRLLQADLPTGELVAALEAGGWVNVEGKDTVLDVCGVKLEFRGTGDAHIGLDDYPKVAGKRKRGAKLLIGVTHAPYRRVLDAMTADGVELILTGLTHGGQV
ncbi:MAG: metallophosphoesterase [Propionibacteriaceae bacterium]|jgi:predicted MPP superfamily phosphohydrolase|nr:metallophosphoesterase [Propionibacteriaceae bacterium]